MLLYIVLCMLSLVCTYRLVCTVLRVRVLTYYLHRFKIYYMMYAMLIRYAIIYYLHVYLFSMSFIIIYAKVMFVITHHHIH